MTVLVRKYLGRSRLAEELVEDWKIGHQKAQLACDLQDLVEECIDLSNLAKRTWRALLDMLFDENVQLDHEAVGESMSISLAKTLHVFAMVKSLITAAYFPAIANAEELARITQETEKILKEFDQKWPESPDLATVGEALSDYHRGAFKTPEELLNEARREGA